MTKADALNIIHLTENNFCFECVQTGNRGKAVIGSGYCLEHQPYTVSDTWPNPGLEALRVLGLAPKAPKMRASK